MEQYAQLAAFLRSSGSASVRLSFKDVEGLIHGTLPGSAHSYDQWWDDTHTQATQGWGAAGYTVSAVDRTGKTVTFTRKPLLKKSGRR